MKTIPEYLQFLSPLTIEAAGGGTEKKTPRFSMVAYTGGTMQIAGFPHPVVVDLEGLSIERQDIPVRLDHNPRQGVGHTERVAIENGQVIAEGLVSRDTSWARDVARSGVNGFPWQASIGARVIEAEFIPHGATVTVNGQEFTGPLHVVRRAVLKEISFVDSGADTNTQAKIAARLGQDPAPGQDQAKEHDAMKDDKTTDTDVQTADTDPAPDPETADAGKTAAAQTVQPDAGTTDAVNAAPDDDADTGTDTPGATAPNDTDNTPDTVNASAPDPVAQMRQQMAAETRRIEAIRKVCSGKHAEIEAKAIEEGWDATKTELHVLRASRPTVPAVATQPRNTSPQVFEAAALMASGISGRQIESVYAEPVLEAADKLRGIGIQEFCERVVGQQLPRFRRDASGWLQAAFSTASLPGILSNIANKMLLEGYNYVEDAWRRVCKIASVNDFKEHTRYRMTSNFTFLPVGPDGELKHGRIDEQTFGQKAATHGIMFALTREMIINDDLAAFTDIPRQIGMGAAEAIADAVWRLLLSNPGSFFSVGHKNYAAGADTVLDVDGLTKAEVLFLDQTKPNGRPLGVVPAILLVPTALKVAAELLMKSLKLNETTAEGKGKPSDNPHVGKFESVSSSYLSNTSFKGASAKAWYLFADPNRLPALEVAFLNGVDRPTVEKTDADFNTLGIQFRGYIDFGVREQDYRGAVKMKGEA